MVKFEIPFEMLKNAKKVGIQLPDGLKRYAFEIASLIESKGFEVVISGETCFGACDIDTEILKEVDYLLHFAHTPMLNIDRVIYVPYFIDYDPKIEIDLPEKRIALISTAQYVQKLHEVAEHLRRKGYSVEIGKGTGRIRHAGQVLGCNYSVLRGSKADVILFIGDGVFHAIGAAIYSGKKVYAFNPLSREIKVLTAKEFIRRRYFIVSKCVGLEKVGILVSSKPGQKRLKLALRLKNEAIKANIKAHIIYFNTLRNDELYNLPYEYYINTACPRISYDESNKFEKPVITPQEFEFLIGKRNSIVMDEIE